ncbi:MAG: hypothetical protein KF781_08070 [Chitinophagaceae bacterium]|nr:hypothetical protein [Chitinophagaceae bacterium]MCW5905713.1 hypothetical protein [Chitinophagaceae bacterium]
MVFLFRDKSISGLIFLLLLLVAVHVHFFITPPAVIANVQEGFISIFVHKYISTLNSSFIFILYILTVYVQAIRLNFALNNVRMFQQQHQTVAMSYILLTGFFTQWSQFSAALVANFFIIWIFIKLAQLHNNPNPKTLLFNTGLIAGITILCYHPAYAIIITLLLVLMIIRPFRIAEWVITLIGIMLPFYFLGAWLYLSNQFHLLKIYLPDFNIHLPVEHINIWLWLSLSVITILLLLGSYYNSISNKRMVIQIRKSWGIIFILFLFLLPVPFLFSNVSLEAAIMCIVPLSAITANVYSNPKRLMLPNILFWLSIVIIIFNNRLLIKQ